MIKADTDVAEKKTSSAASRYQHVISSQWLRSGLRRPEDLTLGRGRCGEVLRKYGTLRQDCLTRCPDLEALQHSGELVPQFLSLFARLAAQLAARLVLEPEGWEG